MTRPVIEPRSPEPLANTLPIRPMSRCYLTHSWEDRGVHAFPKDICTKVNVIRRVEFDLVYYDSAVQRVNHYTTRTPPTFLWFQERILSIYHRYYHHQNVATTQIPSTLSLAIRPYQPFRLVSPLDSLQSPHRPDECKFLAGRSTMVCPCVGVHKRTLFMNPSVFSCMSCSDVLQDGR